MVGGGLIKLKTWQKTAVALGSAVGALLDPRRADLIAALGETTGKPAFQRVLQRMKSSPEGRLGSPIFSYFHVLLFFQQHVCFLLEFKNSTRMIIASFFRLKGL